jgi:thiosulfate/3-mercaptopyruvate sulfurtransferase
MGYARPGRIRGSENVPFPALLDPDTGELLSDPELRKHFEAALSKERVINYCGGGIAATLTAFALTVLGHPNVAVYDGSLGEWSRDESLPMDTGEPDAP